jgi:ABC-2 type transport system ATP-binding protein
LKGGAGVSSASIEAVGPKPGERPAEALDIEVESLTKRFGDFCAVDALSFTVKHGEVFGLLGPNGAGKSTLIRMLTTLIPPTSGSARVYGYDVVAAPNDVRRAIGVIPQAMTTDLDLTADENMTIFAKLYGLPRAKRRTVIRELLAAVDLEQWADKPVKNFSGGMRRRLEIARGLVHEPKIFFLDEPPTGLDPVSRVSVWEMLDNLRKERDLTVLLTTHYMEEADKLCDRIAIIDHGKLVALDSPLKLKASIPGRNVLEVSFSSVPSGWSAKLAALTDVAEVKAEDSVFRLSSNNGPRTAVALLDAAREAGIAITSLSVQSTTLDDVFVHYTGRQLRDALQSANPAESRFMIRRS